MNLAKLRKMPALFVLVLAIGTSSLWAQATRTWVSGVGDDANPCSRTAPCKTFAGAISKTAAGGEIDALDPGGFGALTITKTITIDGGGGQNASVLVSGTNGIVVAAGSSDMVTLRNLSINGIGTGINGIRFISGGYLHVEHCHIFNFTQNGIDIEVGQPSGASIIETVSKDNGGSGLYVTSSNGIIAVSVDRSNFNDNTAGVFAGSSSSVTVKDSDSSVNNFGFLAQGNGAPMTLNISNSTAAGNTTAGIGAGGLAANSTIRISGVSLHDNGAGMQIGVHGTIASFGNNYNSGSGTPNVHLTPQ